MLQNLIKINFGSWIYMIYIWLFKNLETSNEIFQVSPVQNDWTLTLLVTVSADFSWSPDYSRSLYLNAFIIDM